MIERSMDEVLRRCHDAQILPVKMYESADRVTVAAPMPGLEPDDISVEVTPGNQLVLHGGPRGWLKDENLVHVDEWNPGPYCRELTLPSHVDGRLANVTYRNGILVVVLPIAADGHPAHLSLHTIGPEHGERVGNAGHPVHEANSPEHMARHRHPS